MLIYSKTKVDFLIDVETNNIVSVLESQFFQKTGKYVSPSEVESWRASLRKMRDVINIELIPTHFSSSLFNRLLCPN